MEEDILDTLESDDGSIEVILGVDDEELPEQIPVDASQHDANLALYLEDDELARISSFCQERFNLDLASNQDFFDYIAKQITRLGIGVQEISDPFPGATPIVHPLVLENGVRMQAKIMGEVFSGKSFVDAYVTGTDENVVQRANAIKKYMDYQYLVQMSEYIPETERLSFRYSLTGNAYRKLIFDEIENRPRWQYIPEDRFIIDTNLTTVKDADFYTEIISLPRHQYDALVSSGFYKDSSATEQLLTLPVSEAIESSLEDNTGNTLKNINLHEHTCYLKLSLPYNDDEDRALPYIVTRELSSNKVVGVRRNWKEGDPKRIKRVWHVHYKFVPGLGFHGMGLIHLLGNFQFALTQIARSLIDAGQFANLQAGFRAKGVRLTKDSNMPLKFGEFRELDTQQRDIREVLMPLQFKEPSQVLYTLFMSLDQRAQKFADSTEQVIADSSNYGPVGTTVALLEASTKFINGILKRFYNSLKEEFNLLYDLNYDTLDQQFSFSMKGESFTVMKEFFSGNAEVSPSADPNISSTAHRLSIANSKLQSALQAPQIHNLRQAYLDYYTALGMEPEEIAKLLPQADQPQPLDPLSDIIALSMNKPIRAFEGQDHDAHIAVKRNFLQDPNGGMNPALKNIVPALEANIAEHQVMKYSERMKTASSMSQGGAEKAQADASSFLLKYHQMEQTDLASQAGDPNTIMAKAALLDAQTREKELKHKIERDTAKYVLDAVKLNNDDENKKLNMAKDVAMKNKEIGADMVKDALTALATPNA